MKDCNRFPIRHINSKDIPVWGEETLPESAQLLMFVTEKDQQCGQYLPFIYKLPYRFLDTKIGGDDTTTLDGNGANITVPDGQVRAGFVYNNSPNDIRLADIDDKTKPQFLILGHNATDPEKYDVVADGVYVFNNQHQYTVGYTYYLGYMGQPTTDNTGTPLFDVLSKSKIRVRI